MNFKSINPYIGEQVGLFTALSEKKLAGKLDANTHTFKAWKEVTLSDRCALLKKAGQVLRNNAEECA